MSTWDRMEHAWWPAIAESLPKPWPREAAAMDLRWWRANGNMPGRPTLQARWGWRTDWSVRALLANEAEWVDPHFAAPSSASRPPARRQPAASPPPAAVTANAENREDSASPPPARRQPAASRPPSRDPYSTGTRTTDPPLTPPAGGAGPGDPVELVRAVVAAVAEAHADDSDLLALVEVVGGDRLAIERERRAEQQRQREQVWAHAACGDPQLAAEVYARARPQLAALGVRRARAVEGLLVQASGRGPP